MAKRKLRATLHVSKRYEQGTDGYYTYELLLFASPAPCFSIADVVAQKRYGTLEDAVREAEYMAELLGIEIDQRAYPCDGKREKKSREVRKRRAVSGGV